MLFPNIRIQWISDQKGYGIVANQAIPKGTVTFIEDELDIIIEASKYQLYPEHIKKQVDYFSYELPSGQRVITWDLGKYMNHCCHANTLTTGYGFEIAIRDIEAGEEITDDYRIFTSNYQLSLNCNQNDCPGIYSTSVDAELIEFWDGKVKSALEDFEKVNQPLLDFFSKTTLQEIHSYIENKSNYISVASQSDLPNRHHAG